MRTGELLPRLSILTAKSGGFFLLHFPGGYPRLTLSAILSCEARTFLTVIPYGNIPRDRSTKLLLLYTNLRVLSSKIGKILPDRRRRSAALAEQLKQFEARAVDGTVGLGNHAVLRGGQPDRNEFLFGFVA